MSSLFFVPPRPTGNRHDQRLLQRLSQEIKKDSKELILTPCEGKGCSGKRTNNICAGCKAASYCSVEASVKSLFGARVSIGRWWRCFLRPDERKTHRLTCKPRPIGMKRFFSTLFHNRVLVHLLEALFIVHFKLAERTEVGPSSGPLCISASIAMLPYGWTREEDLYITPARPLPIAVYPSGVDASGQRRKAGVELFFQITGLGYLPDSAVPQYDHAHKLSWQNVAAEYTNLPFEREVQFVGLLVLDDGSNYEPGQNGNICPLPIHRDDLEAFRKGTFFSSYSKVEPWLGERVPRPLTTKGIIRYINRHVEDDIENHFRLRTRLRPDRKTLVTWGLTALSLLTGRRNMTREEVIRRIRVYNPDGSKLDLSSN